MIKFNVNLTGTPAVQKMFSDLPAATQTRVLKPLVKRAGTMLAPALKAAAPRGSGLLAASMGVSTLKTYRSSTVFLAVGARRGFRRAVSVSVRGKKRFLSSKKSEASTLPVQNPAKYLHLVTGGRKAVAASRTSILYSAIAKRAFGRTAAAVPANPFVARTFSAIGPQVVAMFESEGPAAIEAAAMAVYQS
jgi:hypothetical protein